MKNKIFIPMLGMIALTLILGACGGPKVGRTGGDNVTYGNPDDVETVSARWGSTDIQMTAEKMTQSLLDSQWISNTQAAPKIRLREVKNSTSEHIDTKGITDKIRINLMRSGKVRFLTDVGNLDAIMDERDLNETATTKQYNQLMMDADYVVTGTVRSIQKVTKSQGDIYYSISLELVDPQSGEILWADEQEIRKNVAKPKLGW